MFSPPDALADWLAATTDADGKGQIQGCRAEDIEAVSVEVAGLGLQGSVLGPAVGGVHAITLKAAGRLTGRVQADDPSSARGLEVIARTLVADIRRPANAGEGRATTDAEGRFEIPALAAGKLHSTCFPPMATKLRPQPPSDLTIEPGKTTEVTIPMEGPPRQRTVAGRVVDRGGQPSPVRPCSSPAILRLGPKPRPARMGDSD